jgi:fermentation-respiration switch protein FrsA (DUF1100 family)
METTLEGTEPVERAQSAKPARSRATLRRRLLRLTAFLTATVALVYLGISAYMAEKVSHPTRKPVGTCAEYRLTCEDVSFASTVDGVPLKGWFLDAPGTTAILMLHGRNSVRDDKGIGLMDTARTFQERGYDVFMFDFRAHGASGGDRYSLGQWEVRDIEGALNVLKERGATSIGALGYSMGAATALNAAPGHPEIKALVTDSSFADLADLLEVQLPRASGLPSFFNPGVIFMGQSVFGIDLLSNKPERAVALMADRPLFIIHSTIDGTVPVEHANDLKESAAGNPNLEFWITPADGHVQSVNYDREEYMSRVLAFFDKHLR